MDARGLVPNVTEDFKKMDYSNWQRIEAKEKKSAARKLTLPPITSEGKKKKGKKNKPVTFRLNKNPPLPSKTLPSQEKYGSFTQRKSSLKDAELAKNLEDIRIIKHLTKLKINFIEELKQHSAYLAETNCRLIEDIQHTDERTAKQARDLLQQHELFGTVKATMQNFTQNRLDTARAEFQEMEEKMEKNLGKLQRQLDEATSKVQVLQDELHVLQNYMDREYPAKAVQIASLLHKIQNLKEQQQHEIDETEALGKAFLEELEVKLRVEQEEILDRAVEEVLLHQDGLRQLFMNNHLLQCEVQRQREIIKDMAEEISELKRSIQTLQQSMGDPRELIFADVLLRRPKHDLQTCTQPGI
ncbi:uncharacterized protein C20orf96 homolog isoform X2 [Dromaius novaehollandiae]|uniref:uncharacterized protein C20orf96 homolog isoform X2 n=1 Tax=Dromaius novaehollandiae TaxID=8790 RepID=UPI00311E513B